MTSSKRERDAKLGIRYADVGAQMSAGTPAASATFDGNQLTGIQAPAFRGEEKSDSFAGFRPNTQRRRRSTLARSY